MAPEYPPFPWRLRAPGVSLATLHPVRVERARGFVPEAFRILPCWPGWTLGGLFLAEYGEGSDLRYRELVACCATVLHRGRPAAWATHLYVDSPDSVAGGRRLLGAPKELAPFRWEESRVVVGDPARPVCRVEWGRPLWLWRQRVRFAALHPDVRTPGAPAVRVHGNELRGRVGLARARVEVPEGSPLTALELGKPLPGVCVRGMEAVLGGAPFLPARTLPVG